MINKILNKKYSIRDIDICVPLTNIELKDILDSLNLEYKILNDNFGVYSVLYNEYNFEVACFRQDISIGDGRRPGKIRFTRSMIKDSRRRDFTINSFYFDPIEMVIYDFNNGVKDITNNILRFIGNPQRRIKEDYIRILRFLKFKNKYKFLYKDEEYNLIEKYIPKLALINQDKVRDELDELFSLQNVKEVFLELNKLKIFDFVLPEFKNLEQVSYKIKDVDIFGDVIKQEFGLESDAMAYVLNKYLHINFADNLDGLSIKEYILNNFGHGILWAIIFSNLGKIAIADGDMSDKSYEQISLSLANDVMRRMFFPKKVKEEMTCVILNLEKIKNFDLLDDVSKKQLFSNRYFTEILIIFLTSILKDEKFNNVEDIELKIKSLRNIFFFYNQIHEEIERILGFLDDNTLGIFRIEKNSSFFEKIVEELECMFFSGRIKTKNGVIKFLEKKTGIVYK